MMRGNMSAHIRVPIVFLVAFSLGLISAVGFQNQKAINPPEIVSVRVSVTDPLGRFITFLQKEHFRIYEDNIKQEITNCSHQTSPISVGLVYDVSASMRDNRKIDKAKSAVMRFLKSGNLNDEHFLVTFNQDTKLVQVFTSPAGAVEGRGAIQKPGGQTALYDAIYMALDQANRTKSKDKMLILITDGEDNSSRYKPAQIREFAKESNVQIYCIGVEGSLGSGQNEIQRIVGMTGGKIYYPNNFNELDYYIDLIHSDLRNQYLLSYSPNNKIQAGKWRKITVKVDPPAGLPKLTIRAREGRYAPEK
jgi:Ca-activated chloride channel homolog